MSERMPLTTYHGQPAASFRNELLTAGISVQPQVEQPLLAPNGIYVSPETKNRYYEYSHGEIDGCRYEQFVTGYYTDLAFTTEMFAAVFVIELPRPTVPLYIQSRTSFTVNSMLDLRGLPVLAGIQHVQLEGDFSEFFTVYSRDQHALHAFTTIVPNLMVDMLTNSNEYDVEFADRYVYFYHLYGATSSQTLDSAPRLSIGFSAQDYIAMREFGIKYGSRFVRAARPSTGDSPSDTRPLWQIVNNQQALNNKRQFRILIGIFAYIFLFYVAWWIVIPLSLTWVGIRCIQWITRKRRLVQRWAQHQK